MRLWQRISPGISFVRSNIDAAAASSLSIPPGSVPARFCTPPPGLDIYLTDVQDEAKAGALPSLFSLILILL